MDDMGGEGRGGKRLTRPLRATSEGMTCAVQKLCFTQKNGSAEQTHITYARRLADAFFVCVMSYSLRVVS